MLFPIIGQVATNRFASLRFLRVVTIAAPVLFALCLALLTDLVLDRYLGGLQSYMIATMIVMVGAIVFSLFIFALLERVWHRLEQQNEEIRKINQQLLDARAQAATDALTGLRNYRVFQEKIRDEVRLAETNGNDIALLMLDIDNFKNVNDSLGHQAGDEILGKLAVALTDIQKREYTYRYGGDEFAVLLPGLDLGKAGRIAERLRQSSQKRMGQNGQRITISLGVAAFPQMASSAEELIYRADAAMYWAKSEGKNRVAEWGQLLVHGTSGAAPRHRAAPDADPSDTTAMLLSALSAKDHSSSAHTERCSQHAAKVAEELSLNEEERAVVRLAALLHDIGKLAVPDEVLFKPGPLDEEEWDQMKRHPVAAEHILSQMRPIADAIPAILHHHEHFDGSGYPDGLTGEHIPMASRIVLVADAFDAMTSDRPYRRAMPVDAALEEIKRNSGSQFDPTVVEAFLKVLSFHGARPSGRPAATQGDALAAGARSGSG